MRVFAVFWLSNPKTYIVKVNVVVHPDSIQVRNVEIFFWN